MIILPEDLRALRTDFLAAGFDIRLVGGCVRDSLKGVVPKDFDLCTDANPDEQETIYKNNNIRHIDTGLAHGTWTVVLNSGVYEITSLRTETDHDGRWATVSYIKDWDGDLSRRDLTINAMALTFDDELIDPYNGKADLEAGIVRFVGNADERMREDYLRILRYFRFAGRYTATIEMLDADTLEAVKRNAKGLSDISRERVWAEMSKILLGPCSWSIIHIMIKSGIAPHIDLPVLAGWMPRLMVATESRNAVTRLAAMLGNHKDMIKLAAAWKLSNNEAELACYVANQVEKSVSDEDFFTIRVAEIELADKGISREYVTEAFLAIGNDHYASILQDWEIPVFPVRGNDLILAGMSPGPAMGAALRVMRQEWVAQNFEPTKSELLTKFLDGNNVSS